MSEEESDIFKRVLMQYKEVFANPNGIAGKTYLGMHSIKLEDVTPIKEPLRRVPLFKRHILEEEISKLKQKRIIEKSCSPWSAPIVLVQ